MKTTMQSPIFRLILLISFFSFNVQVNAQTENTPTIAKEGTYQFIIFSTKMQYAFTQETLFMIESKRKEKDDVTLDLNPEVQVFIPSKEKISRPDFKALTTHLYK
jgi:hypothetical protein